MYSIIIYEKFEAIFKKVSNTSTHCELPLIGKATIGAHCTGHNAISIGICYIGGLSKDSKPKDTRTPQQRESMLSLIEQLCEEFPRVTIHGHNEFANKACPCFMVPDQL